MFQEICLRQEFHPVIVMSRRCRLGRFLYEGFCPGIRLHWYLPLFAAGRSTRMKEMDADPDKLRTMTPSAVEAS